MSTNTDNADQSVPDLPRENEEIDAEAAIERMGLKERTVFRVGDCVYRYYGLDLNQLIVDRLSRAANAQTGRLSLADIWYDYHNGNLERGKWLRKFIPADSSDEEASSSQEDDLEERTVEISAETARTALHEMEVLIEQSGGSDIGADEACSPLALAHQKVEASGKLGNHETNHVLRLLHIGSDERGMEVSDVDPLTDGTFQARNELEASLEAESDE